MTQDIKERDQKKISVRKELNFTVTRLKEDNKKYKNRIKVGVNCIDGDLIGWGDDFLESQPSEISGWNKFQQTFEKGLKGYLNLIFGCDYKKAVEAANSGDWWNAEKFEKNPENIAMVGVVTRSGKNVNDITRGGQKLNNETDFEKIWNLFEGRKPRDEQKRISITNTAVEVWMYNRNEFKQQYIPIIQKLVRKSILRNTIRIVLGAKWCNKKFLKEWKCEDWKQYSVLGELKENGFWNVQDEIFEHLKLDGSTGFTWNPGLKGDGGKPTWMW
ncbi:hypothetical protein [Mycoplasma parvum]|nr:hypothetical protein [Mycoplasma parvum]